MSDTHVEKSPGRTGQLNAVSMGSGGAMQTAPQAAVSTEPMLGEAATDIKFCAIDDPGCEACQ